MDHHWHLKGVDKVILPVIEQILIGVPQTFGEKEALFPMDREWTRGERYSQSCHRSEGVVRRQLLY